MNPQPYILRRHQGGYCWTPGNVGPDCPGIWKPGVGAGVGSAPAVPAAASMVAATAAGARTMFLFMVVPLLVCFGLGICNRPSAHAVPTICPQLQVNPVNYRDVFSLLGRYPGP